MQKILLDTNIILDFLGKRDGFYLPAAKILTLADQKKVKIFISPIAIATAFYLLCKNEERNSVLEKIRKFKMLCTISVMNDEVVEKALTSGFKDFEDGLQYYSALASNCSLILTRNEKDFKNAKIPVMNAESFLETRN